MILLQPQSVAARWIRSFEPALDGMKCSELRLQTLPKIFRSLRGSWLGDR